MRGEQKNNGKGYDKRKRQTAKKCNKTFESASHQND